MYVWIMVIELICYMATKDGACLVAAGLFAVAQSIADK